MPEFPDIVRVAQAQAIFEHTRCLSYRVYFFTPHSLSHSYATHLTSHTAEQCSQRLNALMRQYRIGINLAAKGQQ